MPPHIPLNCCCCCKHKGHALSAEQLVQKGELEREELLRRVQAAASEIGSRHQELASLKAPTTRSPQVQTQENPPSGTRDQIYIVAGPHLQGGARRRFQPGRYKDLSDALNEYYKIFPLQPGEGASVQEAPSGIIIAHAERPIIRD